MERSLLRALALAFCATLAALSLAAQPSLPPGHPPKGERTEVFTFDPKKNDDARREPTPAKPSSSKKGSSSSKSRSAEIRALAFADDSLRGSRPIIVKTGNMEPKVREQLKEDLLVMCRILEKAASEHISDFHKAAGIDLLALGGGNRSVRTIYLDDYGVIFTLNVRIPLQSDTKMEEPDVKEAARNEEWEETRNELFGQRRRVRRSSSGHGPSYDEQDVQELKNELIDALKNAAHIRNLKPSDWITVVANGPAQFENDVIQVERGRGDDEKYTARAGVFATEDLDSIDGSTMVLRVRKGKLDEAAKKAANPEGLARELEEVIAIQIY